MVENSWGIEESTDWYPAAALKLRAALKENGELANLRRAIRNKDWWENGFVHFGFGLFVRTWLRQNGFKEQDVNVANHDDHYVAVMLLAVGYEIEGGYSPWIRGGELVERLIPAKTRTNPAT